MLELIYENRLDINDQNPVIISWLATRAAPSFSRRVKKRIIDRCSCSLPTFQATYLQRSRNIRTL